MRVNEYYGLNRTQPTLDFVDVDAEDDVKLFVDLKTLVQQRQVSKKQLEFPLLKERFEKLIN